MFHIMTVLHYGQTSTDREMSNRLYFYTAKVTKDTFSLAGFGKTRVAPSRQLIFIT